MKCPIFLFHILFGFTSILGTRGKSVFINIGQSAEKGSIRTYIECLIDMDGVQSVTYVVISSVQAGTKKDIISYTNSFGTILTNDGQYLKDRVTYSTITPRSNRTVLYFNRLLCEDDADYQCELTYIPDPIATVPPLISDQIHLNVTILPSKPFNIALLSRNMSKDNLDDHEVGASNVSMCTTSISYEKDCFLKTNNMYIKCNDVIVTCSGTVVDSEGNLFLQVIEDGKIIKNISALTDPSNIATRENCSFIKTNLFDTNITGTYKTIKFRCTPESFIHKEGMYIETEEVELVYNTSFDGITTIEKTCNCVPDILVGVLCTLAVALLLNVIVFLCQKWSKKARNVQSLTSNYDVIESDPHYLEMQDRRQQLYEDTT